MAFDMTKLPRFFWLANEAAFDASKVQAGSMYFIRDIGELRIGKGANSFDVVKDTTVATQISTAIDALTAADIELKANISDDLVAGTSVEAVLAELNSRISDLAGDGEGEGDSLASLRAAVTVLQNTLTGFNETDTVAKGIEAAKTEAKGYTDTEVAKKLGKGTIVAADAEEIIVVSAEGEASASGVKVAELVKSAAYEADKATFALKSEIADQLTKTEAGTTYATKSELQAVTDDYLKAADKEELQGKIDAKVAQSAYDADKATFALKSEIADQLTKTDAEKTYAKIGDAYTKAEADDLLSAKADSATVEATYATKEALKAVTDDYLKGADKTELQGNIDKKLDATVIDSYSTTEQMNSAISGAINTALSAVLVFKGIKASVEELPTEGNKQGDVWVVTVSGNSKEYVWTGTAWEELGDTQVFETMVQAEADLTADKVVLGNGGKNVKTSVYSIGGEDSVSDGNANTLATEAAVNADFDAIIDYLAWQDSM